MRQPLGQNVCHVVNQKLPGAVPQILPLVPVLILGGTDARTQQQASHFSELVEAQAIFNEAPGSVNDLGPCLSLNGFSMWQLAPVRAT